MTGILGACLCGQIEFKVYGPFPGLYQCHCSLCRRATGSAANAALIVQRENFSWTRGRELVRSYQADNYRSDFCSRCGSPVPNPLADRPAYWVPAGSLDDHADLDVAAHLHTASKAGWEVIAPTAARYPEAPDLDGLIDMLHAHGRNRG